jgi:hypothetical protein
MSPPTSTELPQLRDALMRAARRQAAHAHGLPAHMGTRPAPPHDSAARGRPPARRPASALRGSLARRGSLVLMLVAGLLVLAAVAYATTRLIRTGTPVKSEESFSADAGVGVAIPRTTGLLGIAAPDPAGGPPWTMRVYDTSRGLGCVQVGRLVGGRIGVLGEDGAFGDDGRFHPLPTQASQAEGDCVLLDAHGNAFLGVATYDEPASGLPRECHLLGSQAASKSCARSDPREVFYGLLGPDARSITYTLDGRTRTIATVGSEGAYLIVERAPARLANTGVEAIGSGALPAGAGSVSGRNIGGSLTLHQPVRRITYTHGRTCTLTRRGFRNGHGGSCLPPVGYLSRQAQLPSARAMASPIEVRALLDQPIASRHGGRQVELVVSFVAHAAVTSALSGYSVFVQQPDSGKCAGHNVGVGAGEELTHDVNAGEHAQVLVYSGEESPTSLFPGCPGTAQGTVSYVVSSGQLSAMGSFGLLRGGEHTVVVGHFTYDNP